MIEVDLTIKLRRVIVRMASMACSAEMGLVNIDSVIVWSECNILSG